MRFSEEFETRFAEMVPHYPTKRSALVPTLLYAQDEVGFLSDEVIAGNRHPPRPDRTRSAQRDQLLLHADHQAARQVQRAGLHQHQLHGARRRRHSASLREEAGHRPQTNHADGLFTLEEVECIGACSWAPAAQVNYDFHENLTPEKMDRILDDYKKKGTQ